MCIYYYLLNSSEGEVLSVSEDGHHQTSRSGDCDRDVNVVLVHDFLTIDD